jgi:arylsulfatase A-like enzyme
MKQAGYTTAHFGKWHLSGGGLDAPLPTEYGYDDAAVWTGPGRSVFEDTPIQAKAGDAHDQHAASFLTTAATEHALRFIRAANEKPFYLNLWIHETHHLVSATEEDKKAYPDTAEPQRTYYAAITRADKQIGRLLDLLDELKITDNTLVIFSSDNGPENSHAKPGKNSTTASAPLVAFAAANAASTSAASTSPSSSAGPVTSPPVASTKPASSRVSTSSPPSSPPPASRPLTATPATA